MTAVPGGSRWHRNITAAWVTARGATLTGSCQTALCHPQAGRCRDTTCHLVWPPLPATPRMGVPSLETRLKYVLDSS